MTGLGRYALNLVRGIANIDSENEYLLLKSPSYPNRIVEQSNFREIPLTGDPSSVGSVLKSAAAINQLKPDLYHSFMHFLPFGIDCLRKLITLHDLIWIETPQLSFSNPLKAFYNQQLKGRFIKYAVKNADTVIAISGAARQRAIEILGMPPEKCRVIYPGIENTQPKSVGGLAEPLSEIGDYILSLGHSKPYKNVEGIIRAFNLLREKYPALKLLIIGRGDRYPALQQLVADLRLIDRVIFWSSQTDGPLTDDEIVSLFQNAKMLAFPSFVEGFGFPIVEAMAAGCPVLTSNVSAPREIAGNAAVLVNPYDVNDIADGIIKLLLDKKLREELISRGRSRSAEFSVERCARETHQLYVG
jgi:hypothetical protein